jgi:hypothetical protein
MGTVVSCSSSVCQTPQVQFLIAAQGETKRPAQQILTRGLHHESQLTMANGYTPRIKKIAVSA